MVFYICPAQGALQQGLEGRICDRCAWRGDASDLQQLFGQRLGGKNGGKHGKT